MEMSQSHHMAYLYNYIGQPWKTQAMTRRLLDEMYAPILLKV